MNNCACQGAGCKLCGPNSRAVPFWVPVEPMGAVRTTQRQKFTDSRAQRYAAYKQEIKLHTITRIKTPTPAIIKLPEIVFYMPIPKSGKTSYKNINGKRTKRKVIPGQPHDKKPDIDNLIKGLFDALNGIVWFDDAQIYEIGNVKKVWSDEPGIEFKVNEL